MVLFADYTGPLPPLDLMGEGNVTAEIASRRWPLSKVSVMRNRFTGTVTVTTLDLHGREALAIEQRRARVSCNISACGHLGATP